MKIKVLLTSAMTIALCLCVIAGSTFALFTKDQKVKMEITAGALDVTAGIDYTSLEVKSAGTTTGYAGNGNVTQELSNGGFVQLVQFADNQNYNVQASGLTPGDGFRFQFTVQNDGKFAVENTIKLSDVFDEETTTLGLTNVKRLLPALNVTVEIKNGENWVEIAANSNAGYSYKEYATENVDKKTLRITVEMKEDFYVGEDNTINDYQGAKSFLALTVTTVQSTNDNTNDNTNP